MGSARLSATSLPTLCALATDADRCPLVLGFTIKTSHGNASSTCSAVLPRKKTVNAGACNRAHDDHLGFDGSCDRGQDVHRIPHLKVGLPWGDSVGGIECFEVPANHRRLGDLVAG